MTHLELLERHEEAITKILNDIRELKQLHVRALSKQRASDEAQAPVHTQDRLYQSRLSTSWGDLHPWCVVRQPKTRLDTETYQEAGT